jgi:DNA repair protein RadC
MKPGHRLGFFFLLITKQFMIMKQQTTSISEVKLIYRTKIKASERLKIKCSKDAFDIIMETWDKDSIEHTEEFKILLMNRSNSVLGIFPVSKGGLSGTVTDVRLIYQAAIKANASGILLVHNHPSGNLNPSESDSKITKKIQDAGNLMDIQLLDHLIITPEGEYFSFADSGIL